VGLIGECRAVPHQDHVPAGPQGRGERLVVGWRLRGGDGGKHGEQAGRDCGRGDLTSMKDKHDWCSNVCVHGKYLLRIPPLCDSMGQGIIPLREETPTESKNSRPSLVSLSACYGPPSAL